MGKLFGWLNRSYAETIEAYNTRMNRLPVLHAGYVFFDWVNYDAAAHVFSVYIEWNGELNQKLQDSMPQGGYAFRCSQEEAACYINEHNGSPVYVKLHAKGGRLYIKHMYFNGSDKRYELFFNGCDVIPPEMVCFWGRGPVEKIDFLSIAPEETEKKADDEIGKTQNGSYRRLPGSFHGSRRRIYGSYRVGSYRGIMGSYRGLIGSYRSLSGSYRSIWNSFLGMGSGYRGLIGSYRNQYGSYRGIMGSYRGLTGSYRSLSGSYRSIWNSFLGMGSGYRGLFGSYRGILGSYRSLTGSYRGIAGSYRNQSGSYRSITGSYRSLGSSYHGMGSGRISTGDFEWSLGPDGDFANFDGNKMYETDEMTGRYMETDNMVDNTLGYGLDLIW